MIVRGIRQAHALAQRGVRQSLVSLRLIKPETQGARSQEPLAGWPSDANLL